MSLAKRPASPRQFFATASLLTLTNVDIAIGVSGLFKRVENVVL